jgi:hypothetical protein
MKINNAHDFMMTQNGAKVKVSPARKEKGPSVAGRAFVGDYSRV